MTHIREDAEFNRQVGNRIRSARMFREMTAMELATLLPGIADYERIESGDSSIPLVELRRIAIALDVPTYYFLGDGELLHWFDERKFVNTYRILKPQARQKVQNLVFSIAADQPIADNS